MIHGNTVVSKTAVLEVLTQDLSKEIDAILASYQHDPSRLISILLEVQDQIPKQYIPTEVAAYISEELHLPLSRVYDVISFYEALSSKKRADYVIQVCDSVVCKVVGNNPLINALEKMLNIKMGEITTDERFCLEYTPCFGACDIAPAIRLNGMVIGNLDTEEKVKLALKPYWEGGNLV